MAKITIEQIRDELSVQNWTLISENYKNLDEILEYKCPEGHRVFAPWKKMRGACVCDICTKNSYKEMDTKVVSKKKGAIRILALDQATKTTGFSIYDDKELVKYGTYKAPEGEEILRMDAVKNWLYGMIIAWKPDHIAIEGIQYEESFGVTVFQTLARLQGILMECCYENKIPFMLCPTNTWRNKTGVKGRARTDRKRSAQMIIKEKYDVTVTDDEADGVLIGQYAADVLNASRIVEWE